MVELVFPLVLEVNVSPLLIDSASTDEFFAESRDKVDVVQHHSVHFGRADVC